MAAERGRVETVKYLVNFNGANNVNIKDSKGVSISTYGIYYFYWYELACFQAPRKGPVPYP